MPTYFLSFPELFLLIPVLGAIVLLFLPKYLAKNFSLIIAFLILLISGLSFLYANQGVNHLMNHVNYFWLDTLGSSLLLRLDGTGLMLSFLVSLSIFAAIAISNKDIKNASIYYCLIFVLQAGLYGVFLSFDALCFYIFWEVVLIPTYFLCSFWGGSKAIQPTLKFFLYTFLGSIFLLVGILYLYMNNPAESFKWESLRNVPLTNIEQYFLAFCFFIAFAIKMPIFPFHTWQPKLYSNSPIAITLILSSVMVKMGILGLLRWVLPFFPLAIQHFGIYAILLIVIGLLYASLIAIRQNELKLIVAYSSIAHIAIMGASILTQKQIGIQASILQMFNHGVNVIGLWILVSLFERRYNTTNIKELGGIIQEKPFLGFFFILFSLANIALPLTNSFVSEFPMLFSLFSYHSIIGSLATISVVFSAIYMLRAIDFAIFGKANALIIQKDFKINFSTFFILGILGMFIFYIGIYSAPFFSFIKNSISLIH